MIFIDPNTSKLVSAKRAFHEGMRGFVETRITKALNSYSCDCKARDFFQHIISDKLDDILIGKPGELLKVNEDLLPYIRSSSEVKKAIKYVFHYDTFTTKATSRYDAYQLAESLDIRTCPYCNRNYTSTVKTKKGKKLTRPQFDHYFDKATYPLLALSFYNLIPCCSICNTGIKKTTSMSLEEHLHPYLDDEIEEIRFTYYYSNDTESGYRLKVSADNSDKARNTIRDFALEEIYNAHAGELEDLIRTKQYFSDRYLSILRSSLLKDVETTKEDLYRIVFGTEYDTNRFVNRPFSKFKSDILKELGII